jgi:formylglycine-generating enzyme required for sulfatase activity
MPQPKIFLACAVFIAASLVVYYKYDKANTQSPSVVSCTAPVNLHTQNTTHAGMVWIESGSFVMGNNKGHKDKDSGHFEPFPEERGERKISLDGFWMDAHEVTNAQFLKFVEATNYTTVAETRPKKEWFPADFPDHQRVAGSAVFVIQKSINNKIDISQWWQYIEGASWKHPQGPATNINELMNHPVVHIIYQDAQAYAKWAGRELPTEAQWEYAARGGLGIHDYVWGDDFRPNKKWMANTWQGPFPIKNSAKDGYLLTAPVGCYPPNDYGLYDLAGNVWEIVQDDYQPHHRQVTNISSSTPLSAHVIKGGSYLCTPDFCMRYRPTARQAQDYTMGTSHIGFRTVLNKLK